MTLPTPLRQSLRWRFKKVGSAVFMVLKHGVSIKASTPRKQEKGSPSSNSSHHNFWSRHPQKAKCSTAGGNPLTWVIFFQCCRQHWLSECGAGAGQLKCERQTLLIAARLSKKVSVACVQSPCLRSHVYTVTVYWIMYKRRVLCTKYRLLSIYKLVLYLYVFISCINHIMIFIISYLPVSRNSSFHRLQVSTQKRRRDKGRQ